MKEIYFAFCLLFIPLRRQNLMDSILTPPEQVYNPQNERQIEDNLSRECVTYFCPGHLNKFKDRKTSFTSKTITYLTFSPDGCELLVNMGSEQIYLYDLLNAEQPVVRTIYLPIELENYKSKSLPFDFSI